MVLLKTAIGLTTLAKTRQESEEPKPKTPRAPKDLYGRTTPRPYVARVSNRTRARLFSICSCQRAASCVSRCRPAYSPQLHLALLCSVKDPGTGPLQPLHLAARDGKVEELKKLLQKIADAAEEYDDEFPSPLEQLTKCGWSPLVFAARYGHAEAVTMLAEAGAKLTVVDHQGSTALHRAAFSDKPAAIQALVDAGAPMEMIDRCGQTALHVAAANGSLQACKCLVRLGASPAARDGPLTDGQLANEIARSFHETETADWLQSALQQHQLDIKRASMSSEKAAQEWLEELKSKN